MEYLKTLLRRWWQSIYIECDGCAYFTDRPYDGRGLRRHRATEHGRA